MVLLFYLLVICLWFEKKMITPSFFPRSTGFSLMFNISSRFATALSIPATYATAFGFIYAYGNLISSMSASNLMPFSKLFAKKIGVNRVPIFACIIGSVVGYIFCILVYFFPVLGKELFNICIIAAFTVYFAQCVGFIAMRRRFGKLLREFHSPLGVYGAVYSMAVWLLGIVSVAGFQQDQGIAVIVFVSLCVLLSVYYYFIGKTHQQLSEEERTVMFKAHVINCEYLFVPMALSHCSCSVAAADSSPVVASLSCPLSLWPFHPSHWIFFH